MTDRQSPDAVALRLPGWAQLRRRQMDDVTDRLTAATNR